MPNFDIYQLINAGVAQGLPTEELRKLPELYWREVNIPKMQQDGLSSEDMAKVRGHWMPDSMYYLDQAMKGANRKETQAEMAGVPNQFHGLDFPGSETINTLAGGFGTGPMDPLDIASGVKQVASPLVKGAKFVGGALSNLPSKLPLVNRLTSAAKDLGEVVGSGATEGFNTAAGGMARPTELSPASILMNYVRRSQGLPQAPTPPQPVLPQVPYTPSPAEVVRNMGPGPATFLRNTPPSGQLPTVARGTPMPPSANLVDTILARLKDFRPGQP